MASATKPAAANTQQVTRVDNKDYYIVVGTYPNQEKALDTFVRLSSIGLSGAAMETRTTTKGQTLHMVRLGPYTNQDKIDNAKDKLTSDGLSQFKVVEN
jgi:cell division protein FtsN